MTKFSILLLVALCFASEALAKKGFGPGEQEWGYVKVRSTAHMFWWLYYTTANVSSYYEKPLVIWLQGGPGASSTSYGNFEELGPLDVDLNPRNFTWVKDYNILFIDNPVGTGFSYITTQAGYTTTNTEIAHDLLECIKGFLKQLPAFSNVPTYITTESYGGKMGAEFALSWYRAQQKGTIKSNLKGVALGDAWISPIDSVMTWAPFLLATGMVDTAGYEKINEAALKTKNAVDTKQWTTATRLWSYTEGIIAQVTNNIDFYNILTKMEPGNKVSLMERLKSEPTFAQEYSVFSDASLEKLMNGPVKEALQLSSRHGAQSNLVFSKLTGDFMKPVVNIVESLLNETNLKIAVISGHMDLIVDTPGTLRWVEKMQWKNDNSWYRSARTALVVKGIIEGYVKSYGNFSMYWVNRAGHMLEPQGETVYRNDVVLVRAVNFPTLVKRRRSNNPKLANPQTPANFVNKERLFRFKRILGSKMKQSANKTVCGPVSPTKRKGFCGCLIL